MEASPRLQRVDQVMETQIAVMMPTAILLENGPGFSLLISRHFSSEPDDAKVVFEECSLIRIEADGEHQILSYPLVEVKRDSQTGAWIASPDQFETLFLQPSLDCYALVDLDRNHFETVSQAIDQKSIGLIFSFFRKRFGKLPRFHSSSSSVLEAGETYASAKNLYPDKRFI